MVSVFSNYYLQAEALSRIDKFETQVARLTEEARNALRSKNILMEESQEFQTRAEDLAEKLRDSRESERKLEEKFRAELAAQTRLANIYKSMIIYNDAEDSIDEDSEDIDVESPLHPTLKRTRDDILRDTTVPMSSYDDQEKESSEDDDSVVQQK